MYMCWIVLFASVCTATTQWNSDYYDKQYFDYGGHDYHSHGHNQHNPCPDHESYSSPSEYSEWDYPSSWKVHINSKNSWNNYDNSQPSQRTPQVQFGWNFEACLRSCRTTPDYNPVCGTDGLTYINPSALQCVRACGKDVNLYSYYACYAEDPSASEAPDTNVGPTPSSEEAIQACITSCPVTSEYNPVCGTNGVTYTNPSRLECASMCGVDVKFLQKYRCPPPGELPSNPVPSSSQTPPAPPTLAPPTPPPTTQAPPTPPPPTVESPTPPPTPTPDVATPTNPTPPNGFTIPKEILDGVFTSPEPVYDIDERFEGNS